MNSSSSIDPRMIIDDRRIFPAITQQLMEFMMSAISRVFPNSLFKYLRNVTLILSWSFFNGSGPDAVPPNPFSGLPFGRIWLLGWEMTSGGGMRTTYNHNDKWIWLGQDMLRAKTIHWDTILRLNQELWRCLLGFSRLVHRPCHPILCQYL